jgi:hypothetical protein
MTPVERARRLLAVAGDNDADDNAARESAQALIDSLRDATPAEVAEALAVLGQAYALERPQSQALPLTLAGAIVERGADPGPLVAPTIAFLRRATPLALSFHRACTALVPDDVDDRDAAFRDAAQRQRTELAEAAKAWDGLEGLYAPMIALLGTSPEARAHARALASDLAEMRQYNTGASWLWPMVRVLDREPLLVIEPDTGLGLAGTMSGISSNFQLHVLLMDIFPRPGTRGAIAALADRLGLGPPRRVSRRAAGIARGTIADQSGEPVTGQWNLYAWTALQATGRLPHGHAADATTHWIWNEGVPADIPAFEDRRVVLLGPPPYARGFDSQREFLGLRADIAVERVLPPAEVKDWVERFARSRPS